MTSNRKGTNTVEVVVGDILGILLVNNLLVAGVANGGGGAQPALAPAQIVDNDILRVGCLLHHLFDPYCYDLIFVGVKLNAGSIQGRSHSEGGSHLVFYFYYY